MIYPRCGPFTRHIYKKQERTPYIRVAPQSASMQPNHPVLVLFISTPFNQIQLQCLPELKVALSRENLLPPASHIPMAIRLRRRTINVQPQLPSSPTKKKPLGKPHRLQNHEIYYLAVAVVDAEDLRPLGPRVGGRACVRRLRQQLEVDHRAAAVPHGRADAVRAGVTAL